MDYKTADLSDQHATSVQVAHPILREFGGNVRFCGQVDTVKCFEDNSRVKEALAEPGNGKVLVVDAGGSLRCAMLGDRLAREAVDNRWAGVVVFGCIRDSAEIADMAIGVRALATHPRRSVRRGEGTRAIPVQFAGVTFEPGNHVYCDEDGILLSPEAL
ncbi:MAG: ribonuclease E activity regulator RraA [Gammaproteobacteria bacterium]|nr:ribonuclease E activity regulator RraA [Gammaproteobacteria bacterium]